MYKSPLFYIKPHQISTLVVVIWPKVELWLFNTSYIVSYVKEIL